MISDEALRSESQLISDAARVKAILEDEVFRAALKRLNDKLFKQWKNSESPEQREMAWAKTRALEELLTELVATQDAGKRAQHERDRREAAEQSARRKTGR